MPFDARPGLQLGTKKLTQVKIFLSLVFVLCAMAPVWLVVKGLDCLIFIVECFEKLVDRLKNR